MERYQYEFAEMVAKQRREGWGWRFDGLDDWTSEAIFAQLKELGIDTDISRFREQAVAAGGFKALQDDWDDQLHEELKTDLWPDFPLIAVPVLWERLAGDVICPELIDERLYRVILAEEQDEVLPEVDGMPADVAAALGLAKYLQGFPVAERGERFKEIKGEIYDYAEWLLDLVDIRGAKYPDAMIQVADRMSESLPGIHFQADAAMLVAGLGRREEAIARTTAMIERFPDNPWSRIYAGDIHVDLGDASDAIRLYGEALATASDPDDWDVAADRLRDICEEAGCEAEVEEILLRHPSPKRKAPPPRPVPVRPVSLASRPPVPALPSKKVGRNDPCPCGSGKKYKKCCLK